MPLATKLPEQPLPQLHLSSREVPPGGLYFKILALAERAPREAMVGPFNDSDTLTKEVNRREKANGVLPLSTLADVEDQNCQRLPKGYCRDASNFDVGHPGAGALGLGDVLTGTRALLNWFRHGSVEVEEIQRRTAICNACPENRLISGCQGCAGAPLHAAMNAIVVRALPSDTLLGACSICHCSLKAKVRFHLSDLPALTPHQLKHTPEKCWMIAPASLRDADPRT